MMMMMMTQWAWRMNTRGVLKDQGPIAISTMWSLPWQLDAIDAIFERPGDGVIVIFRGRYVMLHYVTDALSLLDSYFTDVRRVSIMACFLIMLKSIFTLK